LKEASDKKNFYFQAHTEFNGYVLQGSSFISRVSISTNTGVRVLQSRRPGTYDKEVKIQLDKGKLIPTIL